MDLQITGSHSSMSRYQQSACPTVHYFIEFHLVTHSICCMLLMQKNITEEDLDCTSLVMAERKIVRFAVLHWTMEQLCCSTQ